jgi:hypothetical protein
MTLSTCHFRRILKSCFFNLNTHATPAASLSMLIIGVFGAEKNSFRARAPLLLIMLLLYQAEAGVGEESKNDWSSSS